MSHAQDDVWKVSVCRFNQLLKKYGVGYVHRSSPAGELSPSSRCGGPSVRRSNFIVANRSTRQYVDTTKFFVSLSSVDDPPPADSSELPSGRTASSKSTSSECRSVVDEDDLVAVDWTSVRLVFVVLDVLLLVHRLSKLYLELDRKRMSASAVGRFSPLADGYAEGISVLPVDGVAAAQSMSDSECVLPHHVGNHVGLDARGGSGDDDDVGESTSNSLCVTAELRGSNNVSWLMSRRHSTGNRRRRAGSSPDIVPRLVCLVALLAALFYARTSTMSRGVLWLRGALPSLANRSPSIFTSAVRRHFSDIVNLDSLSNDFRQLQAFVDFFNRGKVKWRI